MQASTQFVDFLVVGGGVAGLRAAIELAAKGSVLVITKDKINESSTEYAQGGIAVALSDEDEVCIHFDDTIRAGDGLCNDDSVRIMVEEGPDLIRELISWGAEFDKKGTCLSFTREAAHSRRRILHSHGDSTGKEIERALIQKARSCPEISRFDFAFTLDLIVEDNRCLGARVLRDEAVIDIYARAVVLATGGAGQIFSKTTNPMIATGDGIAVAYRAGAMIADMEFIQFHPTTLYAPGAPQFLLSEAMRGEGAILKNLKGERFMQNYHDLAELAPRDTVSRAIVSEMVRTSARHVYLDLTHMDRTFVKERFPRIYTTCLQYDVDISEEMIPVSPAAHYIMGGVSTNIDGETSIRGLFAAGEVACTGVHGANRLASNSLLEGLVFGARAGRKAGLLLNEHTSAGRNRERHAPGQDEPARFSFDADKIRSSLRQVMWNKTGIIRCAKSLGQAREWLGRWKGILEVPMYGRREAELRNMLTVAQLITLSAIERRGSVGAHYRSDLKDPGEDWKMHIIQQMGRDICRERSFLHNVNNA